MSSKPIIGLILGDAAGVGPEIIAKLAGNNFYDEYCRPIILGDARIFQRGAKAGGVTVPIRIISKIEDADWENGIPILDQKNLDPAQIPYGQLNVESGKACLDLLQLGVELFQAKKIDGFCFAPLNKTAMIQAGCPFESEHHYLAHLFHQTEPFGEINVLGNLWTTRTTSHIPIKEVSANLSVETIMRAIRMANTTLINSGIKKPRLGLAALNPHAGEHGKCGREEIDIITPAIEKANKMGIDIKGPFFSGNFRWCSPGCRCYNSSLLRLCS